MLLIFYCIKKVLKSALILVVIITLLTACSSTKYYYTKPKKVTSYKDLAKEYYKAYEVLDNNGLIKEQ